MAARQTSLIGVRPAAAALVAAALWTAAPGARGQAPSRIVSLVPAVTEMLFVVGAGSRVVGVSSFDTEPPEVSSRARVGGLLDPDLERILALEPDLAIVYATQTDLIRQLERAGVPLYRYEHAGLADVLATLRAIGARVGHGGEAEAAAARIEARLAAIARTVGDRPRPRTLVVFGRDRMALRNVFASGGVGFIDDMLEAAGGANVFEDVRRQSLQATSELVIARAPEVILELRGEFGTIGPGDIDRERLVWNVLSSVPAVKSGRVAILVDSSVVVPGPRIAEGVEKIARVLHPDAFE